MPASRIDGRSFFSPLVVETGPDRLHVPGGSVRLRRNGVEFRSPRPFELWTEMTVSVDTPGCDSPSEGTAVVVACEGNRHQGFAVSVLFLDLETGSGRRDQASGRPTLS
jgi:hypothetical protein